jgi:hypothetical protein
MWVTLSFAGVLIVLLTNVSQIFKAILWARYSGNHHAFLVVGGVVYCTSWPLAGEVCLQPRILLVSRALWALRKEGCSK